MDKDGSADCVDVDVDGDGTVNFQDNCPFVANSDQKDMDYDGIGDACDDDMDGDGKKNEDDNCPEKYNPLQSDIDNDKKGDACDDDMDGDGKKNEEDNCPKVANEDQKDSDIDGVGDACDDDKDGDGVLDAVDNCPEDFNPSQSNMDKDKDGDACDMDVDGDGYDKTADCNDLNKNIYPGAPELCNGLDDNCDGYIDNSAVNCVIYYRDNDEDNYGDPNDFQCLCSPENEYKSLNPSDCNDSDALINPKSQEKCDDIDNNCNGFVDEAYPGKNSPCDGQDADLCEEGVWICNETHDGLICNDLTGDNIELCNGKDDDCDGLIPANEADSDGDGFRKCMGDCNDLDINIFPGYPYDDCMDGIDNNCDGVDGTDKDKDGYGSGFGCPDCDDSNSDINPGAEDTVGDGIDQNCDNIDGIDKDGDGYASIASGGNDCNDDDKTINPGAYDWMAGQCGTWNKWTFDRIDKTGKVGEYASIKIDNAGHAHIAYYDHSNQYLKYATDSLGTWQIDIIDSDAGAWDSIKGGTFITLDEGMVHIAYFGNGKLKYAAGVSGSWTLTTLDQLTSKYGWETGLFPSIAVDLNDKAHVSYYANPDFTSLNYSYYRLKYATNKYGAWKTQFLDEKAGYNPYDPIPNGTAIVTDSSNAVHIAYYHCGIWDNQKNKCLSGNLNYLTDKNGRWDLLTVDSANDTGRRPSMFIDGNDLLHISYYETDNGDLKYATINKRQEISTHIIDENGDVGRYSAIYADENGHIYISYYDSVNDRIKIAKRLTHEWQLENVFDVHSLNHSGNFTGMVMGKERELLISFWDELNEDLMIAAGSCNKALDTDQNCDGIDGMDSDGDGFASLESGGTDCDDSNSSVFLGNEEDIPGDDIDANCDGADGIDADGDGYAADDCNDNDVRINIQHADYVAGECSEYYWETYTIAASGNSGSYASIAVAPADFVYISYDQTDGNGENLRFITNKSGSWIIEKPQTAQTNQGSHTSITLDTDNKIHISYRGEYFQDLRYATNASGTWINFSVDEQGDVGQYTSIASDKSGFIHIAYFDAGNKKVKYSNNVDGYWQIYFIDTATSCGGYTSLALDGNGAAHIAYYAETKKDLKYAENISGKWQVFTLDSAGDTGTNTSIAVSADNIVHISYIGNSALKYASDRGGNWQIITLDTEAGKEATSIRLDKHNAIHIAYRDGSNTSLKYASNKTGIWRMSRIDTGDTGKYASLALDSNDFPHISYVRSGYQYYSLRYLTKRISETCPDSGNGWCSQIILPDGVVDARSTSISIDNTDHVHMAFSNDKPGYYLGYATNKTGSWSILTVDSTLGVYTGKNSLALDKNENVHISYNLGNPNYYLKYATDRIDSACPDSGNSWCMKTLVSTYGAGWKSSITTDGNNSIYISYSLYLSGKYKMHLATTNISSDCPDSGNGWCYIPIDSATQAYENSIVVDQHNNVYIAYQTQSSVYNLKYATNRSGSWQIYLVDSSGKAGYGSSIKIDKDNFIHISYQECQTDSDCNIKYATDHSGEWSFSRIETRGDISPYGYMAIGSDNMMHAVYGGSLPSGTSGSVHPMHYAYQFCKKTGTSDDINCDNNEGTDNDKDGFASMRSGGTDCNDYNPDIYPGAEETPGDNIDSNCNGDNDL